MISKLRHSFFKISLIFCISLFLLNTNNLSYSFFKKNNKKDSQHVDKEALDANVTALVDRAIENNEFPGCQIFVMKNKEILINKAYGYLTYDSLQKVTTKTLYDLASITKVAATTLVIMDLFQKNRISLDETVGCYLPQFKGSNKEHITIRSLLAHNSRIKSYLPFWKKVLHSDSFEPKILEETFSSRYGHFTNRSLQDSLKHWILDSKLNSHWDETSTYNYSDLGFILLQMIAESILQEPMELYLSKNFYQPMGLSNTHFNPKSKGYSLSEIAPTDFDSHFRCEWSWGYVNDRNAAISGGVSGHAGLFSNAQDMAKFLSLMMDAYLSKSNPWILPSTMKTFNTQYFEENRRALGWDTPTEYMTNCLSDVSFGHRGFTGTMIWADPVHELIFVFLSNRVYPDRMNNKLYENKTRSKLLSIICDMTTPCQSKN